MIELIPSYDPRLKQPSRDVTIQEILNGTFTDLISDMRHYLSPTMGIGIAAPQLGQMVRIASFEDTEEQMKHVSEEKRQRIGRRPIPYTVLINPRIQEDEDGEKLYYPENCLSYPGQMGVVPRSKTISVNALNMLGEAIRFRASGWFARAILHEVDHLNGIAWIDAALPRSIMHIETFIARYYKYETSEQYRLEFA